MDSAPRAYRLKASNACLSFSTFSGATPSANREGITIHLYNLRADKAILNAPLKSQCARDYLYGKDLKLEELLQQSEGSYASFIRKLETDVTSIDEPMLCSLRGFSALQAVRTEASMLRYKAMVLGSRNSVFQEWHAKQPLMSDERMMLGSLHAFGQALKYSTDLKPCLLINKTRQGFFTSDDPTVLANRLHTQKLNSQVFGWSNSGAFVYLALTPAYGVIYYDGLVYTIRNKMGITLDVSKASDVDALNELVALNCSQKLYFAEGDEDNARQRLGAIWGHRCERSRLRVFISVRKEGNREELRIATEEEKKGKGPFVIQTISVFPAPRLWPSFLRYRDPLRMFSNGSAIGYVRKQEWLRKEAA